MNRIRGCRSLGTSPASGTRAVSDLAPRWLCTVAQSNCAIRVPKLIVRPPNVRPASEPQHGNGRRDRASVNRRPSSHAVHCILIHKVPPASKLSLPTYRQISL